MQQDSNFTIVENIIKKNRRSGEKIKKELSAKGIRFIQHKFDQSACGDEIIVEIIEYPELAPIGNSYAYVAGTYNKEIYAGLWYGQMEMHIDSRTLYPKFKEKYHDWMPPKYKEPSKQQIKERDPTQKTILNFIKKGLRSKTIKKPKIEDFLFDYILYEYTSGGYYYRVPHDSHPLKEHFGINSDEVQRMVSVAEFGEEI